MKLNLKERISNPFTGALIISWIAINWKLVYFLLFGKGEVLLKIDIIKYQFNNELYLYVYPVCSAIIIIIFYPFASNLLYKIWVYHRKTKKALKYEDEKNDRETIETSRKLRKEIEGLKEEVDRLFDSNSNLEKKLVDEQTSSYHMEEDYKNEIAALMNKLDKFESQKPTKKETKLNEDNTLFVHSKNFVTESDYIKLRNSDKFDLFIKVQETLNYTEYLSSKVGKDVVNYFLGKKILRKIGTDLSGGTKYEFTDIGTQYRSFYLGSLKLDVNKKENK